MLQRVIYIDKEGERMDIVARVIRRRSKEIVIKIEDYEYPITIPRGAVESISDPKIED
jgi:hypothetical protein